MEPQAIHLGNGAYASIGLGGELVITANDHDPDIATDAVYHGGVLCSESWKHILTLP